MPQLGYIAFLERNSHIIYPLLALIVIVLLAIGIRQAWLELDLEGLAKTELKREIILALRREVDGLSAETLARRLGIETFKAVKLLEEMQRDGVILAHTNRKRLTLWRVNRAVAAK